MTNPTKNMFSEMPSDIVYASAYGYLSGMLKALEICVRHTDPSEISEDVRYLLMRYREVESHKEARLAEIDAIRKQRNDALMAQTT